MAKLCICCQSKHRLCCRSVDDAQCSRCKECGRVYLHVPTQGGIPIPPNQPAIQKKHLHTHSCPSTVRCPRICSSMPVWPLLYSLKHSDTLHILDDLVNPKRASAKLSQAFLDHLRRSECNSISLAQSTLPRLPESLLLPFYAWDVGLVHQFMRGSNPSLDWGAVVSGSQADVHISHPRFCACNLAFHSKNADLIQLPRQLSGILNQ